LFGYIKPFSPELKVKEAELYKSMYCGLCKTLRNRYGILAALLVNYDMVFVSMLLADSTPVCPCKGRCIVSPFRKKNYLPESPGLDIAADATIINAYWKLDDDRHDEGLIKGFLSGLLQFFFKPLYRKAVRFQPILSSEIETSFRLFSNLEKEGCTSMDRLLDAMGRYAGAMAYGFGKEKERILYDQARFVTLADALDDYRSDISRKRFNLIYARYGNLSPAASEEIIAYLLNLFHDQKITFQALEITPYSGILQNIITFGNQILSKKLLEKAGREGVTHE